MSLIQEFNAYIDNWQSKLNQDEWFFTKFIDGITTSLSAEEAFNLIPDAIDLVMSQKDKYLLIESMNLLIRLIRISNTTEIPNQSIEKFNSLNSYFETYGDDVKSKVEEINRLYRIKN